MSVSNKPIHEKLQPTNLGNRGVWFVGSSRADSLVLVVNLCRRPKSSLERPSAVKRAGPPLPVDFPDGLRDLNVPLHADLLEDQGHREQRSEVVRAKRLVCARVQRRRARRGQVCGDVVPAG